MLRQTKKSTPTTSHAFSTFSKNTILSTKQQKSLKGGNGNHDILNVPNSFVGDTDIMDG